MYFQVKTNILDSETQVSQNADWHPSNLKVRGFAS